MKSALGWVMSSRWRAILVVVALTVLPLTGILGAAVLALVVLTQGLREGLLAAAAAGGALLLMHLVTGAGPLPVIGIVGVTWLPVLVLAAVLGSSRSQARTLTLAGTLGCGAVLGIFVAAGDPAQLWEEVMRERMLPFFEQAGVAFDRAAMEAALPDMAALMTGVAAAFWALGHYLAVIVGRWSQAVLYRPGGFRDEFHALRLGLVTALGSGAVFIVSALLDLPLLNNVALVLVAMYAMQGLAVMHGVAGRAGLHWAWLVPPYALALILPPHMVALLAVMGFADHWVDFRGRIGRGTA